MFLYRPPDIPETYLSGLDLYLWISSIILLLISGILFLRKMKKTTNSPSARSMYEAFVLFNIFMVLNKITFLLSYFTKFYTLLLGIGYICAIISIIPLVRTFEKYILKKTKYIFSILCIIILFFVSLVIIFPEQLETIRTIAMPIGFIPTFIVMIVWIWGIKISTGSLRSKAIWTLLGVITLDVGYFLDSEVFIRKPGFPLELAPILFIFGIITITYAQLREL